MLTMSKIEDETFNRINSSRRTFYGQLTDGAKVFTAQKSLAHRKCLRLRVSLLHTTLTPLLH